jgi:hypothetical protein
MLALGKAAIRGSPSTSRTARAARALRARGYVMHCGSGRCGRDGRLTARGPRCRLRPRRRLLDHRSGDHDPRNRVRRDLVVRKDSAFYGAPACSAARRAGAGISVTARTGHKVRVAIAAIPGQAWTPIRFPASSGMTSRAVGFRRRSRRGPVHRVHLAQRTGDHRPADRRPRPRPQPLGPVRAVSRLALSRRFHRLHVRDDPG